MKKGRPPIMEADPERVQRFLTAVKAGAYIETAAAFAGINRDTIYDWMKKGAQEAKGPYREFSDTVGQALAAAEIRDVTTIGTAAAGRSAQFDSEGRLIASAIEPDWRAAAWRLERRSPERWGRRDAVVAAKDQARPTDVRIGKEYEGL